MLGTSHEVGRSARVAPGALRLAVLPDFREENWPSMDLCADMLLDRLVADWRDSIRAEVVCPAFRRRLERLPGVRRRSLAYNGDRFLNRHWDFPRYLRTRLADYDVFHICDHSYAQLALELPAERTGVFCYDLEAFRSLLDPQLEPRPRWFRWMMRRVLRGFQRAAVVFHCTLPVRDAILRHGLAPAEKLVYAPLGCAREFTAEPRVDQAAEEILARLAGRPYLLHVGSCVPRKRVDFLLKIVAAVRARAPEVQLVKVGGTWTCEHEELIRELDLASALIHVQGIDRATLAALYRNAFLVLLPSEAEGFGLPVIEALACGSPVLATDLDVLREVGGSAVVYAGLADLTGWRDQTLRCLNEPEAAPPRSMRLAQAQRFTWENHARIIAETYQGLAT